MNLDGLTTVEMTRAMPRVPVSHAKMGRVAPEHHHALSILADETPEAKSARIGRMDALRNAIRDNVDSRRGTPAMIRKPATGSPNTRERPAGTTVRSNSSQKPSSPTR